VVGRCWPPCSDRGSEVDELGWAVASYHADNKEPRQGEVEGTGNFVPDRPLHGVSLLLSDPVEGYQLCQLSPQFADVPRRDFGLSGTGDVLRACGFDVLHGLRDLVHTGHLLLA
jgi:hypothetical protein